MSNLQQTIQEKAVQFAAAVVNALRGASLEELMNVAGAGARPAAPARAEAPARAARQPARKAPAEPRPTPAGRRGRLARRSAEDIANVLERIVSLLAQHPEGLRSEQIQSELGLDKKELPRPISEGLSSGRLSKEGNKRATTYFASEGGKKRSKK